MDESVLGEKRAAEADPLKDQPERDAKNNKKQPEQQPVDDLVDYINGKQPAKEAQTSNKKGVRRYDLLAKDRSDRERSRKREDTKKETPHERGRRLAGEAAVRTVERQRSDEGATPRPK